MRRSKEDAKIKEGIVSTSGDIVKINGVYVPGGRGHGWREQGLGGL